MAGRSEGVSTPGAWQKVRAASAWPVWVYRADCTVIFNLMGVFRRKSVMHGPAAGRSPSKIERPTWGILEKGTRCSGNGSLQAFGMSENCHPPFITDHIWLFEFLWWCSPHISFCPYKAPPCDLIHFELLFCGERACRFFLGCLRLIFFLFSFFLSVCSFPWLTEGIIGKQNHFSFIRSLFEAPFFFHFFAAPNLCWLSNSCYTNSHGETYKLQPL